MLVSDVLVIVITVMVCHAEDIHTVRTTHSTADHIGVWYTLCIRLRCGIHYVSDWGVVYIMYQIGVWYTLRIRLGGGIHYVLDCGVVYITYQIAVWYTLHIRLGCGMHYDIVSD